VPRAVTVCALRPNDYPGVVLKRLRLSSCNLFSARWAECEQKKLLEGLEAENTELRGLMVHLALEIQAMRKKIEARNARPA
jgi:hypothetical protein